MRRQLRTTATILAILFLLASCGGGGTISAKTAAYKTIQSMDVTYDGAFKALGEAYKQGKITETDKTRAIAAGREFKKYRDAAVEALIIGTGYDDWVSKAKAALDLLVGLLPKGGK